MQAAARDAVTRTASVTPLKGTTYADDVHALMHDIAAGLGDDYADTGAVAGRITRSKRGDAVLTVSDSSTAVVLEMTDSARTGWGDYLDEAERNRGAHASLGLVRRAAQNAGQSIRILGSRRIVMAFDPAHDEPDLLRTVILLLRTAAVTASSRSGADEIATAEDKLTEALGLSTRSTRSRGPRGRSARAPTRSAPSATPSPRASSGCSARRWTPSRVPTTRRPQPPRSSRRRRTPAASRDPSRLHHISPPADTTSERQFT